MDIVTVTVSYILGDVIPKFHVYLQVMLGILILWILCKKKDPTRKMKLTREEENDIIFKWHPEPLVNEVPESHTGFDERVIDGKIGKYITVNGLRCLNLASHSFLGFNENEEIEDVAAQSVRKYGVGSCGPRGFFGTVDVHLELEERIEKFMGLEEAAVYSYGFSTIASAIPAYSKRGDIIFVDEEVNFAIQKGLDASRSNIKYFKHNDMEDLENLLIEQSKIDLKNKRKAEKTRRFLVVEGIYIKTGEVCPLPELIALRKKYRLRIFIDESISFGTLGKTGRGVTEHYNIPTIEVDLIMASLEFSMASVGGFCVGSHFIVEHQRLSGLGYCFSASLPPLLTEVATKAIDILENNPQLINELQHVCETTHNLIMESKILVDYFNLVGESVSPIKYLRWKGFRDASKILKHIVMKCQDKNLALTTIAFLHSEKKACVPSIKLCLNRLLTNADISFVINVLEESVLGL